MGIRFTANPNTDLIAPLDYGQTDTARRTINRWVERQTRDKIKELLKSGILSPATVLVLANAIYFKDDWANPFKPENTRSLPFNLTSLNRVNTPTMYQTRLECRFYADAEVEVLELPYKGDRLSMVVLLPRKGDGLAGLEQGLTAPKLKGWIGSLARSEVDVWLPKFKATSEFRLDDKLKALGMVAAFGAADFTGMFQQRGPSISAVVHKAFVEVNEQGTEAVAATGVVMKISTPPSFRVDHPFLFLIRDKGTGCVLFFGRIVNPLQAD